MKPARFAYHAPETLSEVLALLADTDSDVRVMAGGQSLMPMMRLRISQPEILVDLNRVEALKTVTAADEHVRIGAMVRQAHAMRDADIATVCPLIAKALHHAGPIAVRNRGTIGGTLAHADRTAELPAVAVALDAIMEIDGVDGPREVPASDFFLGDLSTAIDTGEMLVAVRFPRLDPTGFCHFDEVSLRNEGAALASLAVSLTFENTGAVAQAALAVAGVEPAPLRLTDVEAILTGYPLTADRIARAAKAAHDQIDPLDDPLIPARYRRHITRTLVARALHAASPIHAAQELSA